MQLFTVHVPTAAGSEAQGLERAMFVSDRFHMLAFVLNALWCLWRGLWIAALGILVAGAALYGLGRVLNVSPSTQFLLLLVPALLTGLEAANLRRYALARRGYVEAGTVAASNRAEAEDIFFHRITLPSTPVAHPGSPSPHQGSARTGGVEEVVGLFPEYRKP